jgi:hypothetical protein
MQRVKGLMNEWHLTTWQRTKDCVSMYPCRHWYMQQLANIPKRQLNIVRYWRCTLHQPFHVNVHSAAHLRTHTPLHKTIHVDTCKAIFLVDYVNRFYLQQKEKASVLVHFPVGIGRENQGASA